MALKKNIFMSLLLIYLIIAVSGLHFYTESTLFRRSMMKIKNCIQILCAKTNLFRKWDLKGDRWLINRCFLDFSIVIDSDKRTSLRAFKKKQIMIKIEPVTCIWMFWYEMSFELPEMAKKWSFRLFMPNLPRLGLVHPYFVCKSSFRVISMVKIILDQSEPISLILKNKKLKIKKS